MASVDSCPQEAFEPELAQRGGFARTIAFFGHDSTESTIIKRVTAFQAHKTRVIGFMFRRAQRAASATCPWVNIELGTTVDRHYVLRLIKIFSSVFSILRHRYALRQCQLYYARNIDMLLLAIIARMLMRSRAPVVYEVLDIQRIFVGRGPINKVFRRAERFLMARTALLVVSSPDFISEYFLPYQGYSGRWRLLENKVLATSPVVTAAQSATEKSPGPPWTIGWFGTLRCVRSLKILSAVAEACPDGVNIYMRGLPSQEDLTTEMIEAACAGRKNMRYGGPYRSQHDLASIYGDVHFAWCIDYLDAGANSDWLLPNRVYEGGLMGCLALARLETATARMVDRLGLGWSLDEPLAGSVCAFLTQLTAEAYQEAQRRLEAMPRSTFVDLTDTRDLMSDLDAIVEATPAR